MKATRSVEAYKKQLLVKAMGGADEPRLFANVITTRVDSMSGDGVDTSMLAIDPKEFSPEVSTLWISGSGVADEAGGDGEAGAVTEGADASDSQEQGADGIARATPAEVLRTLGAAKLLVDNYGDLEAKRTGMFEVMTENPIGALNGQGGDGLREGQPHQALPQR